MAVSEHKPDPCPIHTLDEAVLWLAQVSGEIDFDYFGYGRVIVSTFDPSCDPTKEEPRWLYGEYRKDNGFDWRGMVMMATRDLWAQVNKAVYP